MSAVDAIDVARAALDRAAARVADLERIVQDFDAELAGCDDEKECARIACRRMDVALELAADEASLRGIVGSLALIAREERAPQPLRRAA